MEVVSHTSVRSRLKDVVLDFVRHRRAGLAALRTQEIVGNTVVPYLAHERHAAAQLRGLPL